MVPTVEEDSWDKDAMIVRLCSGIAAYRRSEGRMSETVKGLQERVAESERRMAELERELAEERRLRTVREVTSSMHQSPLGADAGNAPPCELEVSHDAGTLASSAVTVAFLQQVLQHMTERDAQVAVTEAELRDLRELNATQALRLSELQLSMQQREGAPQRPRLRHRSASPSAAARSPAPPALLEGVATGRPALSSHAASPAVESGMPAPSPLVDSQDLAMLAIHSPSSCFRSSSVMRSVAPSPTRLRQTGTASTQAQQQSAMEVQAPEAAHGQPNVPGCLATATGQSASPAVWPFQESRERADSAPPALPRGLATGRGRSSPLALARHLLDANGGSLRLPKPTAPPPMAQLLCHGVERNSSLSPLAGTMAMPSLQGVSDATVGSVRPSVPNTSSPAVLSRRGDQRQLSSPSQVGATALSPQLVLDVSSGSLGPSVPTAAPRPPQDVQRQFSSPATGPAVPSSQGVLVVSAGGPKPSAFTPAPPAVLTPRGVHRQTSPPRTAGAVVVPLSQGVLDVNVSSLQPSAASTASPAVPSPWGVQQQSSSLTQGPAPLTVHQKHPTSAQVALRATYPAPRALAPRQPPRLGTSTVERAQASVAASRSVTVASSPPRGPRVTMAAPQPPAPLHVLAGRSLQPRQQLRTTPNNCP